MQRVNVSVICDVSMAWLKANSNRNAGKCYTKPKQKHFTDTIRVTIRRAVTLRSTTAHALSSLHLTYIPVVFRGSPLLFAQFTNYLKRPLVRQHRAADITQSCGVPLKILGGQAFERMLWETLKRKIAAALSNLLSSCWSVKQLTLQRISKVSVKCGKC